MIAEMPHASAGSVKAIKNAVHLGRTPLDTYRAPPKLGEHTHAILTGLLRLQRERVRGDPARQRHLDGLG